VIRRTDVGSFCFLLLVMCRSLALIMWIVSMLRRNEFGALPAGMWTSLLIVVLLCSGILGVLDFIK
jgi:hypothetical protein